MATVKIRRSVAVALCGGDRSASAGPVAAGDDGGTVVIYSGRTQNLVEPILDRFAEETGIDVEVRYGNTSDLALLIDEEGDSRRPTCSCRSRPAPSATSISRACSARSPDDVLDLVARAVPRRRRQLGRLLGPQAGARLQPRDRRRRPSCRRASSTSPTPEWTGRIGVAPSNASFQDFVTAMRLELGDEATREWLEGIAANDAVHVRQQRRDRRRRRPRRGRRRARQPLLRVPGAGRGSRLPGRQPQLRRRRHRQPGDRHRGVGARRAPTPDEADRADRASCSARRRSATSPTRRSSTRWPPASSPPTSCPTIELVAAATSSSTRQLGGDLQSTREMIRDAGLEG